MRRISFNFWGLLPAHVIMLLMLIIPIGIVIVVSFSTKGPYGGFEYLFTTKAYEQLLFNVGWTDELEFNPQYLIIIGRTILLAALTTVICLCISFPVAYFIAQQKSTTKALLVYLVTLPFWVSMIVRVYAWLIILGNEGVIEKSLRFTGLVDDIDSLCFLPTAPCCSAWSTAISRSWCCRSSPPSKNSTGAWLKRLTTSTATGL
jgi:spermidine/putrescine transport system permease protein